jgi:hypothetical protein
MGVRREFERGPGQAFLLIALPDRAVLCLLHKLLPGAGCVRYRILRCHVLSSLPCPYLSRLVMVSVRAIATPVPFHTPLYLCPLTYHAIWLPVRFPPLVTI